MNYEPKLYDQLLKLLSYMVISIIFPIALFIILCELDPFKGEKIFEEKK